MMLLRLILIVILIIPTIGEVSAAEHSHQKNIKALSHKSQTLEKELKGLNPELDSILSRIYMYREQQEKDYSIFREFGLKNLLKIGF